MMNLRASYNHAVGDSHSHIDNQREEDLWDIDDPRGMGKGRDTDSGEIERRRI